MTDKVINRVIPKYEGVFIGGYNNEHILGVCIDSGKMSMDIINTEGALAGRIGSILIPTGEDNKFEYTTNDEGGITLYTLWGIEKDFSMNDGMIGKRYIKNRDEVEYTRIANIGCKDNIRIWSESLELLELNVEVDGKYWVVRSFKSKDSYWTIRSHREVEHIGDVVVYKDKRWLLDSRGRSEIEFEVDENNEILIALRNYETENREAYISIGRIDEDSGEFVEYRSKKFIALGKFETKIYSMDKERTIKFDRIK
jgi:hypothetical protein